MEREAERGRLFEIKRFAVHDGPGIRTTFFFKGCPLRCVWCHNPEGIGAEPEIAFLERLCAGCGACFAACPRGLHVMRGGAHTIRREDCGLCLSCVRACMPGALKFYGAEYTAQELLDIALEDADFFKTSGGGVTCSGGEPLSQADFAAGFLRLCRESGLHTAVDTSGCAAWPAFEKVMPYTCIFLYDLKHMDAEAHRELTGIDNRLILENLQRIGKMGVPVEIRMPVVPGLNDGAENLRQTADFLLGIDSLTLVRPLPYHALSGSKYAALGKAHRMPPATGDERAAASRAAAYFASRGLPVYHE